MTQSRIKFASFEDYLSYSNDRDMEGFYELIDGELVELPPESELGYSIQSLKPWWYYRWKETLTEKQAYLPNKQRSLQLNFQG